MIVNPRTSTATIRKMGSSGEERNPYDGMSFDSAGLGWNPLRCAGGLRSLRSKIEIMETGQEFYRIQKLPPYVFAVINEMKAKARAEQLDVVDLGMGNPDGSTPEPIVKKLIEAGRNPRNHSNP